MKISEESVRKLIEAAEALLVNAVDRGDCLIDSDCDIDEEFNDYPTDEDGDRWYNDWWDLKEALKDIGIEVEASSGVEKELTHPKPTALVKVHVRFEGEAFIEVPDHVSDDAKRSIAENIAMNYVKVRMDDEPLKHFRESFLDEMKQIDDPATGEDYDLANPVECDGDWSIDDTIDGIELEDDESLITCLDCGATPEALYTDGKCQNCTERVLPA